METISSLASNILCAIFIMVFAFGRISTPRTNQGSTRRHLYRQAVTGYIVSTLLLFILLSLALFTPSMRQLFMLSPIFGDSSEVLSNLSAPIFATVLLTSFLPRAIYIRDVDNWLLNLFMKHANIPKEIIDMSERLDIKKYFVERSDIENLRVLIGDLGLPEHAVRHLRYAEGNGLQISQYRFTQVVKLYWQINEFAKNKVCQRNFFRNWEAEVDPESGTGGLVGALAVPSC